MTAAAARFFRDVADGLALAGEAARDVVDEIAEILAPLIALALIAALIVGAGAALALGWSLVR